MISLAMAGHTLIYDHSSRTSSRVRYAFVIKAHRSGACATQCSQVLGVTREGSHKFGEHSQLAPVFIETWGILPLAQPYRPP